MLVVRIDTDELNARRATLRAMMAERPVPRHKRKIADEFDALIQASSRGHEDWARAIDEDVFDWCCTLDSEGNGATWVHDTSCPCVGLTHGNASPPGSGCAKRCAAQSIDTGLVSKLRMVHRQQLGKKGGMGSGREERKPLLEFASRIVPYIRYRGAKESRGITVVKQAAPMLA